MTPNTRSCRFRLAPPPCPPTREPRALGRVAAGTPLEAIEDGERRALLELLTAPGRYALRVGDDSLSEAGILAGDFVVVQSQQQARNGDIVLALLDNERLLLKRMRYRPQNRILLLADDPLAENLIVERARLVIQGRVVGQIRRYR
jgi:repressor LexA